MKKNSYLTRCFLFVFVSCLLCCCKPESECSETVETYYKLSEFSKSSIPYSGHDTLTFLSEQGDTSRLYGQGRKVYETLATVDRATCPPASIAHQENIEILFTSSSLLLRSISFKAFKQYQETDGLTINVNNQNPELTNFQYVKAMSIEDSVFLNNSYRTGVYVNSHNKTVLVNFSEGILKLKNVSGLTWTRIM